MTTKALLARIDAKPGSGDAVEKLLTEAQSIVEDEPGTTTWFALRFGHGEYGIFDAFPDDAGRGAHLDGRVVAALNEHSDLLDGEPEIERLDVLADKLTKEQVTKALLLRLPIKDSHADDAAAFLRDGASIVAEEPATVAWFAVRFADGAYGVFDVFPDTRARRAHLTGQIPRQLALHGLPWLGGLPNMSFADVLAQKL